MPITLNGNGTITGISTGGISDTKAVAVAAQPVGSIIQVQNTNVTALSTISLTNHSTLYDTPLTVNITSTRANSKFSIQGLFCGEGTQPDHDYAVILRRVIGGSGTSISIGDSGAGERVTRTLGVGYFNNDQDSTTSATTTTTIASVAIATYTAAFFDYSIKNGTNVRAGTVVATHDGTNVEFNETSTVDLGDTSDVTLSVDISSGDMRLRATTTSSTWTIKALIRGI